MTTSQLDSFIFRGLLASHAINEMRAMGELRTPTQTKEERSDQDLLVAVPATIRGTSIEMQRSYRLLYVFENLVRQFVDQRFTEVEKDPDWWEQRATTDMKRKFADRRNDAEKNGWHQGRNHHPLFYIDFGDLSLLIINHWAVFKDYFPNQAWISSRIQESERSRNVIAHTNQLPDDEIARLERHVRDWIAQVS